MTDVFTCIEQGLGYRFSASDLLATAVRHRSASASLNNERLEFLGDAVLGMIIADELFNRFPNEREGALTRLRASLVKKETLADLAREIDLGDHLELGDGERKSGGWKRDSILADALEAIIGAIYIDSSMAACRQAVLTLFEQRLGNITSGQIAKDAKTRLQEIMQQRKQSLPEYQVRQVDGEPHSQNFTVDCSIEGYAEPFTGNGSSIKRAEQAAATAALQALQNKGRHNA